MRVSLAALSCLLLVCQSYWSDAAEGAEPVEQAFERFIDAFNRLDWEAFRSSFADDASLFNPDIPEALSLHRLDGRENVDATFRLVFDAIRRAGHGPNIVPRNLRVQQLADTAIVTFEFERASGSYGRRTIVFTRQPEAWKIVHVHASNINPK